MPAAFISFYVSRFYVSGFWFKVVVVVARRDCTVETRHGTSVQC